jgi:rod shape-determining protein MreD
MRIIYDNRPSKKRIALRFINYGIVALLLSIFNVIFLQFISVGGITPDLLLILCVWIALAEGQFAGLFAGFFIGLLFDLVSSDVIGTNALAKTIAAFIAGWFYKEGKSEQTIGKFQFLLILFLCSIVHNLIYFFFYLKTSEASYLEFILKYGLAVSLYTTVFGIFAMFIRIRRSGHERLD